MTKETQSFVDIVRQFGSDLGLPKVDVDKLVETHRKNFEALTQTALVASNGLKSLATKQKEMVEFRVSRSSGLDAKFQAERRSARDSRQATRNRAQGV